MDDKDKINKQPTSAAEGRTDETFEVAGNVRRRG